MDQRKFSQINGKGGYGWMGRIGGIAGHLQQSFLRMKTALKIRMRNPRRVEDPEAGASLVEVLVDTVEDIIGDGSKGSQFLCVFVGNLDTKFFFDRHKRLQQIEGIETEVVI